MLAAPCCQIETVLDVAGQPTLVSSTATRCARTMCDYQQFQTPSFTQPEWQAEMMSEVTRMSAESWPVNYGQ